MEEKSIPKNDLKCQKPCLVGGCNNPFEKNDSQIWWFPQVGVNIKTCLKLSPSMLFPFSKSLLNWGKQSDHTAMGWIQKYSDNKSVVYTPTVHGSEILHQLIW